MGNKLIERWMVRGVKGLKKLIEGKNSSVTLAMLEDGNLTYEREFSGKDILSQAVNVKCEELQVIPNQEVGYLLVEGMCWLPADLYKSKEGGSRHHRTQVAVYDRVFSEERGAETPCQVDFDLWMNYILWNKTNVAVKCSCSNFLHVWSKKLSELGALFTGRIAKYDPVDYRWKKVKRGYEKETGFDLKKGGRRPREVEQELRRRFEDEIRKMETQPRKSTTSQWPGACVHVWAIVKRMEGEGWIR